jgi:glycosyltransferase involved in cell wall biosynthesis
MRYLILGQTPPPFHGQAVVTGMLFEHAWSELDVTCVRMSYSDSISSVGRFRLSKVWHLFSLIWKTWKVAATKSVDVLYYPAASANSTPVVRDIIYLLAVRWCFKKVIYHYHAGGLPEFFESRPLLKAIAKLAYGRPDVGIDVAETVPPTGAVFGAKNNVVVPNGVAVELAERELPRDAVFRALFVGILSEGKGLLDLIETARILMMQKVDFEFMVVGDWADDGFMKLTLARVEEYELDKYVTFTGPLFGERKWQAYANADCLFFPSHYEAETFGMVLVEAMAFGLPIVTTLWRGIPKVLGNSGCGYLCDINAPEQYAEKLTLLIDDPALREAMGSKGRIRYEEEFTKQKFLERMEDVFLEVVNDGMVE